MSGFEELHLFTAGLPLVFISRLPAKERQAILRDSATKVAQQWVSKLYGENSKYTLKAGDGDTCAVARRSAKSILDNETIATDTLIVVAVVSDVDRKSVRELTQEIWAQVTSEDWGQFGTRSTYTF